MKSISFPAFFFGDLDPAHNGRGVRWLYRTPRPADGIVAGYTSRVNSINDYSMEAVQTFSFGNSQSLEIHYKRPYQYLERYQTFWRRT